MDSVQAGDISSLKKKDELIKEKDERYHVKRNKVKKKILNANCNSLLFLFIRVGVVQIENVEHSIVHPAVCAHLSGLPYQ